MKRILNDKKLRIVIIAFLVLIPVIVLASNFYIEEKKSPQVSDKTLASTEENLEALKFLSTIAGVKANNIEIVGSPVGFKGELFAPEEALTNGVNYFLEKTNNEKMENLSIRVVNNEIKLTVDYKVMFGMKTPIEVNVSPKLNEAKDLVIEVGDVRFLDLKIADFIVNMAVKSFIKDWFPSDGEINVKFNKGEVIIDKGELKGVELQDFEIENGGLNIKAFINLEKF